MSSEKFSGDWDKVAKLLIEAQPKTEWVEITRQAAARGQIESAVLLWFLEADIASIHALAVASQEILHTLGKKVGKPSLVVSMTNAQPKHVQKAMRLPQNFFKHAHRDSSDTLRYRPVIGEINVLDAVMLYGEIFGKVSPLMRVFLARFAFEEPTIFKSGLDPAIYLQGAKIDDLSEVPRSVFMVECLRRVPRGLKDAKYLGTTICSD